MLAAKAGGRFKPRVPTLLVVLCCAVLVFMTLPLAALGYHDPGGGGPIVREYLAYTEWPTLHPDRVDEIEARAAYRAFSVAALHPDRVDEVNARRSYLAYTEQPTLHPDRVDEAKARAAAGPTLHPDRIDEIEARQ